MKRFLRILELTKNEQRVVLIVMLALIAIAFAGYQRRVHHCPVLSNSEASPTPVRTGR